MNRRNLLSHFGGFLIGLVLIPLTRNVEAKDDTESPHAEALKLVFDKCRSQIVALEQKYFKDNGTDRWQGKLEDYHWHDTIVRNWSVNRPFAPGVIDSTHLFNVTYSINNKVVIIWSVDTKKKTVNTFN